MDTLVTPEWLAQHLDDPDLVVLDCTVVVEQDAGGFRGVSGRARYEEGHIPGAGFADLTAELSDPDGPVEYTPPSPEAFCAAMGALGVGDRTRVVLYDTMMSMWAARVWWMLRWVGFDRAALLDGGLKSWTDAGYPLSTEPAELPVRELTPRPRPSLIADRDEVLAATRDDEVCIVDTFHEPHFRGEEAMYARPGHVPGAVNIPAMALYDENGRFRPPEELAALHTVVNRGDRCGRAITYCGGGIMASASAFAMHRLGFDDVAVYTASMQEWAADPELPMVTGSETGTA